MDKEHLGNRTSEGTDKPGRHDRAEPVPGGNGQRANGGEARPGMGKSWFMLGAFLVCMLVIGIGWTFWDRQHPREPQGGAGKPQQLIKVESSKTIRDSYDVIVVGTDPEGIAAAVSSARNGLKTLLVDGRDRDILGGLFTLGWLNTIDMNRAPGQKGVAGGSQVLNKGFFSEWFKKIEGDSFDVTTAANAFYELVKNEPNIDLLMKTTSMVPMMQSGPGGTSVIEGLQVTKADGTKQNIRAKAVIDATQDADIAAAAGVPYTYGREDLGDKNAKMAVTLVFRLKNVTPDVWKKIRERLEGDNDPGTGANEVSAWGFKEMYNYQEVNKGRVKMRGLNVGRQNDNTVLINALQIFGIDGTDPKSRAEGMEIGKKELPYVVDYMRKNIPEFANVELDATAPELYVRETRHIQGEYRLNILDVCENRDQWDRIAFGSYEVDIQRTSPTDSGAVVCVPEQYAIPFRSIVPKKVDGLLVVGRSASYDTLPHGSARTVPVGMAEGQAAGAAAKLAIEKGITFRQLSASKEDIAELQKRLNEQGMELKPFQIKPQPYMQHKAYPGLRAALMLGLATSDYNNNFKLDEPSNPKRVVNLLGGARKIKPSAFVGDPQAAIKGMSEDDAKTLPVTLNQAAYTIALALGYKTTPDQAVTVLEQKGLLSADTLKLIGNQQKLTNGDTYLLIKDLQEGLNK